MLIPQDEHKQICRQRRDREKAQRIRDIVEAARKVFASKGYLKATMDEIALEAEVTKPTIYLYFKAKDDLFFSLMLPFLDDIRRQLEKAGRNLQAGKIQDGEALIAAVFDAFYQTYRKLPETFRIITLFQQQGLMGELRPEVQNALNDKGRANFILHRKLLTDGTARGLIKNVNVYEMADVIWGAFVGIVQLEEAKACSRRNKQLKDNTLRLAKTLIAQAMTNNKGN